MILYQCTRRATIVFIYLFLAISNAAAQDFSKLSFTAIDSLTEIAFSQQNFQQAISYIKSAKEKAKNEIGTVDTTYASYVSWEGYTYLQLGRYPEAAKLYEESSEIYAKIFGRNHEEYGNNIGILGTIYKYSGDYTKAEQKYLACTKIIETTKGKDHFYYGTMLNNLGMLYQDIGNYPQAEKMLLESRDQRARVRGKDHADYAQTLNNLANLYVLMGNYDRAEPMFFEAAAIWEKAKGRINNDFAINRNSLGRLYSLMENNIQAEKYFLEGLQIWEKIFGKEHPEYAVGLSNLAAFYQKINNNEKALQFTIEAKDIKTRLLGKEHSSTAASLGNLAGLYKSLGQLDKALDTYLESARVWQVAVGEKHTSYINTLPGLADLYIKIDNKEQAWLTIHKALKLAAGLDNISINITESWADSLIKNDYPSPVHLNITIGILDVLYNLLDKEKRQQAQLLVTDVATGLLKKTRDNLLNEKDKLRILAKSYDWLQYSFNVLDFNKQANKAFALAELNKSTLLLEALNVSQAYRFGSIPDSLVDQERKLLKNKSKWEASAMEKTLTATQKDSILRLINGVNFDINQLKQQITDKFPRYATFKYQQKEPSAADIQAQLPEQTAMLAYVVGNSQVYAFYLSQKEMFALALPAHRDSLKSNVQALHTNLSDYNQLVSNPEQSYKDYTEKAYWLYEQLIQPLSSKAQNWSEIQHLIIIPDGELSYIPFETLLSQKANGNGDYNQLNFLIKDFKISYNYSASFWYENKQKPKNTNNGQMLAMAANYTQQTAAAGAQRSSSHQNGFYRSLRDALTPLPAARQEVSILSEHFLGLFTFDSLSSERIFKQKSPEYGIIHLAMHGLLDKKNPILSSLAFTEDFDTLENNFLQAHEISQMQLNADLVVLSACETGFGKFEKGNGTASLARAFMYAGVPALVVSLWEVNDASTSQLMQYFYNNLAQGIDKAEALRQAKLQYLQGCKGSTGHPAYWSAFIQMGDEKAIEIRSKSGVYWLWWLLGAVGTLSVLVVWMRLKRKK